MSCVLTGVRGLLIGDYMSRINALAGNVAYLQGHEAAYEGVKRLVLSECQ